MNQPWNGRVAHLLQRLLSSPQGAALQLSYEGAQTVVAPLARIFRIDPDGVLWLLPLPPHVPTATSYDLTAVRRRGFHVARLDQDRDELHLHLSSGGRLSVRPADATEHDAIAAWDDFCQITLSAEEREAVESLQYDTF